MAKKKTPTPKTPSLPHEPVGRTEYVVRLERERDALLEELRVVREQRDAAQSSLSVRYALRREVEEALGMTPGAPASDEVLREGLERIRELLSRPKKEDVEGVLADLRKRLGGYADSRLEGDGGLVAAVLRDWSDQVSRLSKEKDEAQRDYGTR